MDTTQAAIVTNDTAGGNTVINGWTHEAPDFGDAVNILANEIQFLLADRKPLLGQPLVRASIPRPRQDQSADKHDEQGEFDSGEYFEIEVTDNVVLVRLFDYDEDDDQHVWEWRLLIAAPEPVKIV